MDFFLDNNEKIAKCSNEQPEEGVMSIVKVIEVISEGDTVDEAMKAGVAEASKSVKNISQINVVHIEGLVRDQEIKKIRVNSKISFVLEKK